MLGAWSRFKSTLPVSGATIAVALAGAQLIPIYPRTNPQVDSSRSMDAQLEIAAPIRTMLDRSCKDCHSNETRWPWYSKVAPMSWKVAYDVFKAREVMNFSDWSDASNQKLDKAIGLLTASCTDVTVGRMPKPEYVLMHSQAALSKGDVKDFCKWAMGEGKRLMAIKRKQKAAAGQ